MVLILTPAPFAILFLIFAAIVAGSKYVSLGSVTAMILYPIVLRGYFAVAFVEPKPMPGLLSLSTIIIAILVVWSHRENLRRISERKENKLSFKSKKKDTDK